MATVILNHRVKDFKAWKALYDSDAARRAPAGIADVAVGEKAGDPGNVFIIWTMPDPSELNAMLADPELKQRMAEGGVISAPELTILN